MQSHRNKSVGSIAAISLPFLYHCVNCMRKVANTSIFISFLYHQAEEKKKKKAFAWIENASANKPITL
jgi:hypothetical protein